MNLTFLCRNRACENEFILSIAVDFFTMVSSCWDSSISDTLICNSSSTRNTDAIKVEETICTIAVDKVVRRAFWRTVSPGMLPCWEFWGKTPHEPYLVVAIFPSINIQFTRIIGKIFPQNFQRILSAIPSMKILRKNIHNLPKKWRFHLRKLGKGRCHVEYSYGVFLSEVDYWKWKLVFFFLNRFHYFLINVDLK